MRNVSAPRAGRHGVEISGNVLASRISVASAHSLESELGFALVLPLPQVEQLGVCSGGSSDCLLSFCFYQPCKRLTSLCPGPDHMTVRGGRVLHQVLTDWWGCHTRVLKSRCPRPRVLHVGSPHSPVPQLFLSIRPTVTRRSNPKISRIFHEKVILESKTKSRRSH